MEKTKFKIGDIVYWQDLQGEVIDAVNGTISCYIKVKVKFNNDNNITYFTIDGRLYSNTPPVLSHTPYTLNGFSQNEVIEKDTLVWVRMTPTSIWQQQFYSHFKDGNHYCFSNQQTSKEREWSSIWTYLETTNPLIK